MKQRLKFKPGKEEKELKEEKKYLKKIKLGKDFFNQWLRGIPKNICLYVFEEISHGNN